MKYIIHSTKTEESSSWKAEVRGIYFAGSPDGIGEGGHISFSDEGVVIQDLTVFPGTLTRWAAVKWGVLGILRLGPLRITKIKEFFEVDTNGR